MNEELRAKVKATEAAWERYLATGGKGVSAFATFRAGFNAGAAAMHERHMTIHRAAQKTINDLTRLLQSQKENVGD